MGPRSSSHSPTAEVTLKDHRKDVGIHHFQGHRLLSSMRIRFSCGIQADPFHLGNGALQPGHRCSQQLLDTDLRLQQIGITGRQLQLPLQ